MLGDGRTVRIKAFTITNNIMDILYYLYKTFITSYIWFYYFIINFYLLKLPSDYS